MKIIVNHPVPSWNAVLALEHWGRAKLKKEIQDDFLLSLRASGADFSTKITSAKNSMSIAADTLACYQEMRLAKRKSRWNSKRLNAAKMSGRK